MRAAQKEVQLGEEAPGIQTSKSQAGMMEHVEVV